MERHAGDQEQDSFVDPDAVKVTKINSFDLKTPMSQQEAGFRTGLH
jgi:hypothetical protein